MRWWRSRPGDPVDPIVPRSSWRVGVLAETDRLEADLDSAASDGGASATRTRVGAAVEKARTIANGPNRGLPDWWSGASVESAWQAIHLAQEELVLIQPPTVLHAQVPRLEELTQTVFTPARAKNEMAQLSQWSESNGDPLVAKRILAAYHARSDVQHQKARSLRNMA